MSKIYMITDVIICYIRGGSRISERGFGCIKVCGFALLILSKKINIP